MQRSLTLSDPVSPRSLRVAPTLGVFTAASLLVSNAVGSGIFTTTGFMARDLGSPFWVLAVWTLGGALALAGALCYAELGAALPRSGGEYVYLRRAYGPLLGFLGGWTSFTLGFGAAIAAASVSFAVYLSELAPAVVGTLPRETTALLLVWALTALHAHGTGVGGRVQRAFAAAKVAGIGLLVVAAFGMGDGCWSHLSAPVAEDPGPAALAVSLVFVLYAFSGWNAAGYIAGELRDPERSVPRATIGGTVLVALLYLALNAAYLYALPVEALAAEPILPVAEKAARALFGAGAAAAAIQGLLCLSIAGAASAMIWAGPRVYAAMAGDGALPGLLGRERADGTPVVAILAQSLWVSLLVVSGSFEALVIYSGVALAVWSGLAVGALLVLRRREPALARPYRVALYPWVPLLYAGAMLLIVGYGVTARPLEATLSAATVLAGVPLYYVYNARRMP